MRASRDSAEELEPAAAALAELVRSLDAEPAPHLHRTIAEAMAIHETSFFRDGRAFDVLRTTILPRLIAARGAERTLRIWSAATSTGQEAYSVAMLICEHFPHLAEWDVRIVGTDISAHVIEQARRGAYCRLEVNRGLPARMLVSYLTRAGEQWQVASRLRSMCEFRRADLRGPLPELPMFDLVLLRNLQLYLPPRDRAAVFANVHRHMTPGGYLLLGTAEQAEDSTDLFQAECAGECCFYRPVAQP